MDKLELSESLLTNPERLLEQEYVRRSNVNGSYSLRAYGRSLGISHTVLSLVLSGQRNLSRNAIIKLGSALDLTPDQLSLLVSSKKSSRKSGSQKVIQDDGSLLGLREFSLIADWVHYGILSLLELPMAEFSPQWICSQLGVSEIKAKSAMGQLVKMNLISYEGDRWRQNKRHIRVENKTSTSITRKFQSEMLSLAQNSLEKHSYEERDHSSITMAIDPKNVEFARNRIRQFRRELCQELEELGDPQKVYNLTVQFYPVN